MSSITAAAASVVQSMCMSMCDSGNTLGGVLSIVGLLELEVVTPSSWRVSKSIGTGTGDATTTTAAAAATTVAATVVAAVVATTASTAVAQISLSAPSRTGIGSVTGSGRGVGTGSVMIESMLQYDPLVSCITLFFFVCFVYDFTSSSFALFLAATLCTSGLYRQYCGLAAKKSSTSSGFGAWMPFNLLCVSVFHIDTLDLHGSA